MKKINKGTFLRAYNSPLATVQSVQFGNSLFGDFTTLVQVDGLYFVRETRVYYKTFDTEVEESFFMFNTEAEAKEYFAEAVDYAEEFAENAGTVAGGF